MFALPGNLVFYQLYCVGTRIALDVEAVAHDLDNGPGVIVDQAGDVQRVLLRVGLYRLYPPALASW